VSRRALLAAVFVGLASGSLSAEEKGPYAEGSLAWIASDRLDLVGTVAVEIPLVDVSRWRVFTALSAVTAIEKSTSNFTFLVDQVNYAARFGARRQIEGHGAVEFYAGEQGLELVDADGFFRVRVVGAAWESRDFHRAFGPFGWTGRVAAAAVVEHHGVDAIATASGQVRYVGPVGQTRSVGLGADASFDALFGDDHGADFAAGPRVEFDLTGDRRFGLFARWLHAGNPLGLGSSGVIAGFDFAEGVYAGGPRATPPEITGLAAAGAGSGGRGLARLDIRVATPPFLRGTTASVEVDGNVLTAEDRNDLFYLYDVGIAHPVAAAWLAGVWFHHRSNHVAGAFNETVTSINALETGVESDGWNRAEPSGFEGKAGALDARLRVGWLINSSFGEDTGWHARGGARWSSPELGPARIYVSAEAERGDVAASAYAAGALLPRGWDLRIEFRHDEQWFSVERRARLAIATLRY
jgi:hypothetical protein